MYTNFGAELMATAKEYPVKIRKIPVLDKRKLFKNPRCQAGWNKNVLFGFS